jgi:hypothetical protein
MATPAALPEFLRVLFWDLELERLDPRRDRRRIIARIAEYGTDEAVRWLRTSYSPGEIADALERERRLVSRRTRNLWRLWLGKDEDWCTEIPSRPLRGKFWRS